MGTDKVINESKLLDSLGEKDFSGELNERGRQKELAKFGENKCKLDSGLIDNQTVLG